MRNVTVAVVQMQCAKEVEANIAKAEENAKAQFEGMFQAMGYNNVRIRIEHGIIKEKDK